MRTRICRTATLFLAAASACAHAEDAPPPSGYSPTVGLGRGFIYKGLVVPSRSRTGIVFLAPGRTGVIPSRETGVAKEADVARAFPIGADVEVIVLEVDATGRRIRLSAKAVVDAHEAAELREYRERADSAPSEGFGSLADKLRGALEPKR